MQLTPRHALMQFGHLLQTELFPQLETAVGPLSPQLELLTSVMALVPYMPKAAKVFKSAWIPAPPAESLPAIVSA